MDNIKSVLTNNDKLFKSDETDDLGDDVETCICTTCGYEEDLGIDDEHCDLKTCTKCGSGMTDSVFTDKKDSISETINPNLSLKDKMKIMLENKNITIPKKSNKCICVDCGTVIAESISINENNICPKCGDDMSPLSQKLLHIIESERHFSCPKCKTISKYTKINESECPLCRSLMVVFDKPFIKKENPTLPID